LKETTAPGFKLVGLFLSETKLMRQ